MADGCESFALAGALCASSAERIYAVRLFHLFCLSADSRRNSLLPARFEELLGSDDVFSSRLRVRLCHFDVLSRAEPVVHAVRPVARRSDRWSVHRANQLHREM